MTRTQQLALSLKGQVVEDYGYRGVVWVQDQQVHLRYHITYGVHEVRKAGNSWQSVRPLMTSDELKMFLIESGTERAVEQFNPLDRLCALLGGELVQRFSSGGGVLALGEHRIRVSPITGLSLVEKSLTKWREVAKLLGMKELYETLSLDNDRALNRIKEVIHHGADSLNRVQADAGGSAEGSGPDQAAEGAPEELPSQAR